MKLLSLAIAGAALIGSVAAGSVTASAQSVGVGVGPGGVYVGSDNGYRDGYRGDRYDRRDWRDSRASYRDQDTVVVRKKRIRPDGTVVITRERY